MHSTQSTPAGFLLVFFSAWAFLLSALGGYASRLLFHKEHFEHVITGYSWMELLLGAGIGLIFDVVLFVVGIRMAWSVKPYDTCDPKEPPLKF